MHSQCKSLLKRIDDAMMREVGHTRLAVHTLFFTGAVTILSGCTAVPLKRLQPVIAPPNPPCAADQFKFLASESAGFHYVSPSGASLPTVSRSNTPAGPLFETYYKTVKTSADAKLPPGVAQHKVTNALIEFMTSVSGEAQLDAQIAEGVLSDPGQIAAEREAIRKHNGPIKLTHREMKDFADKLFDLQLKPGPARLIGTTVDQTGLSAKEVQFLSAHPPLDKTFVAYFEAYYNGKFVDRMSTLLDKPQISATIPDSEIVAAETVLLEFLVDLIDPTPVMGDAPFGSLDANTTFYPGNSKNQPTAYSIDQSNAAKYVQIPKDHTACGITTTNAWILRDLANGASSQAAAVGGLVANTPGGLSIGLGVLGKISVGDNQTLSVMVKTAASRIALRATLASSYWTLRHVRFDIPEP
jgi:hypothetical protein